MPEPWCKASMLADAYAEIERFDLRAIKVKVPSDIRRGLLKQGVTTKEGGKTLLWDIPLITGSSGIVEVESALPKKGVWPARKTKPYVRFSHKLGQVRIELNFKATPKGEIKRVKVFQVPYEGPKSFYAGSG